MGTNAFTLNEFYFSSDFQSFTKKLNKNTVTANRQIGLASALWTRILFLKNPID